jgi:hypothetical protein
VFFLEIEEVSGIITPWTVPSKLICPYGRGLPDIVGMQASSSGIGVGRLSSESVLPGVEASEKSESYWNIGADGTVAAAGPSGKPQIA